MQKTKLIFRLVITLIIVSAICIATFYICKWTGLLEHINSIEKIRELVSRGEILSVLIFMLLQILQTTVLQIPSVFVTIAGALVFGAWQAFIISFISILLGSIIMFWIGRRAGNKFLSWLIGKEQTAIWKVRLDNGKYLFFLMMLFPFFPDDILCVVAGMTNMSFSFFIFTNIIARGLAVATMVFLGGGQVIPFSGWGLVVWGIIFVSIGIIFYLSVRFKDKIDEIFMGLTKKFKNGLKRK